MAIRSVAAALCVAAALLGAQPGQAQVASDSTRHDLPGHDGDRIGELRLIGLATLPHGLDFQGTVVGGLSGLDWDPVNARWTALSDDRSATGPARFYTLAIDYDAQAVRGIRVTGVTPLRDKAGQTYAPGAVDPESIRRDPLRGILYWSSEGDISAGIDPSINVASPGGTLRRSMDLPQRFKVSSDGKSGPRNNLVFEGLALSRDGRTLFASMEAPLIQDADIPPTPAPGPVRITAFDTLTGRAGAEYVYVTDPLPAGGSGSFGVSEILSGPGFGRDLLVLERTFIAGVGNKLRLYVADRAGATDVSRIDSLAGSRWRPMRKTLLLDFDTLSGVRLDNFEAMGWGPRLRNGNPTLVVMSDDNFSATQITEALVFELRRPRWGN
ncbi:esterase-like activity of phytase family protein [Inquilinus sp. CA228]|uniref:esterase-like activity of phytase family protein n=1 Tax=Inquilinus sp. CA228 TaxID=3455609 RepID=UPI003F8D5B11